MKKSSDIFSQSDVSSQKIESPSATSQIFESVNETVVRHSERSYSSSGLNITNTSPFFFEKINALCSLLWQGKNKYEQVAQTTSDTDLRRTILTLAQESNQYACELSSQIESLGGSAREEDSNKNENNPYQGNFKNENEVLTFCMENENKMVSAYRDILNESYLYEGLRNMIRYQLNGITCAFMQVKLLNSLKVHY